MKRFVLFLAMVIVGFITPAQAQPGAPNRAMPPSIGRIYGKIVDSTGKGIQEASVLLLQTRMDTVTKKPKDVLLRGVNTQANGDFNMEDLPIAGNFKVSITATGYKPQDRNVKFTPPVFDLDLGRLNMETDVQQLSAVVVTSSNPKLRMDIDKKVFSVDQNIVSAGGTAVDVMKNVPSVNVDIDGNVTLRNASPQVYIDGRPTTLSLDQIPADAIESVEVITNPSARYDASGGNAGILNIVLKKNKKSGYNGMINAGVDKRGGMNGGANFSFRQDKINFSASAFGNKMKNRNTGSTDIRNLLSSPNLLVNQDNTTKMNNAFIFGRVGVDYFATNRTTLSLSGMRVNGKFSPHDFLTTDSVYDDGGYVSYSERNATNKREFTAYGLQGGFKYLFPTKGEELTGDFNYFTADGSNSALYNTDVYSAKGGNQTGISRQQILGDGTMSFLTVQSDYVRPFRSAGKLEAGVRAQLRKQTNAQGNYFYDFTTEEFSLVPSASSNYRNTDNVYAAYLSLSDNIKNFGYKIGLRAERSDYEGELTDTKQTFNNNYPVSLFPSVFFSQKLEHKQELQLSYTRRINRPFFLQLIPFIDSTDQLNWSRGNAGLKPEFINSIEASYSKTYSGNNTFLASVYYKYSTDLITRFIDTIGTADVKRPIATYINANSSRSVGLELTSQNTFTKWWDANGNVNIYNSKINADNIEGASQDAIWSWFAKVNNTFKLPSNFKIQLSGTYQSKTNLPINQGGGFFGGGGFGGGPQSAAQGYIRSNYGVDVAVQKSFLKNNAASVTLNFSDIFRSRRFDQYSESPYFIQNSYRLNDAPMVRLNFSFRFGQMDMSLFKRKNMKGESESMQATQGL
ncbi:MAG: outer membrane beta-barrel protein [Chitinophagaceae bacterium]|nr:outer membrane beta-barrel protein [Chitinophagaceae bacterium]